MKFKKNIIELFLRINGINWATFIISVVSISIIFLVKTFINQKYQSKLRAPIPIELVIVNKIKEKEN